MSKSNEKELSDTPYGTLPKVPIDVFPVEIGRMLNNAKDAYCIPIEITVTYFLALLSALIGRASLINIKDSWAEAGNLWLVVVANSGVGKSPCMQEFFRTLYSLEHNEKLAYNKKRKDYEEILNLRRAKASKDPNSMINLPEKPKRKQTIVNDVQLRLLVRSLVKTLKGCNVWLMSYQGSCLIWISIVHLKEGQKLVI